MIEIFDSSCSRSLGQSASIRAAIDILNCPVLKKVYRKE